MPSKVCVFLFLNDQNPVKPCKSTVILDTFVTLIFLAQLGLSQIWHPHTVATSFMEINNSRQIKPVLVFACGNPSRGDDALGPEFLQRLEAELEHLPKSEQIELLTDFQFQIEHAVDLKGREHVVFVDASLSAATPFEFKQIFAAKDASYSTHSMSPEAVLDVYQTMYQQHPPACYVLSIRGDSFELGDSISPAAGHNLEQALEFIKLELT